MIKFVCQSCRQEFPVRTRFGFSIYERDKRELCIKCFDRIEQEAKRQAREEQLRRAYRALAIG